MDRLLTPVDIAEILSVTDRHARILMQDMHPINISTGTQQTLRVWEHEFMRWLDSKRTHQEVREIIKQPKKTKASSCTNRLLDENGHLPTKRISA